VILSSEMINRQQVCSGIVD